MSQVEAQLLHQLNLLAAAVVLLVLFLAAAIGAIAAFADAWQKANAACADLRSWYRGHSQQRTVETLMYSQVQREMLRRQSQPPLPPGERQRTSRPPPPSSMPAPLEKTWPSSVEAQPHTGERLVDADQPHTPRPPPLPDVDGEASWTDSIPVTESMLLTDEPANDESEPLPLVQKPQDKATIVWPRRKLPRVE